MIFSLGQVPGLPNHDRILIRPEPPKVTSEGGLHIPDAAKVRASFGTILSAGLDARDKMYDNGHEIGDFIWHGKFAGCLEEWDHYTGPLPDPACKHEWVSMPAPDLCRAFRCTVCQVKRVQEPLIVMSVDDILLNETLGRRIDAGAVQVERGKDLEGRTAHIIKRKKEGLTNVAA